MQIFYIKFDPLVLANVTKYKFKHGNSKLILLTNMIFFSKELSILYTADKGPFSSSKEQKQKYDSKDLAFVFVTLYVS